MMRHACGSSDHPDPQTFLQLYRLLSTYSLIKPPKGSSVAGSDMLSALLSINDVTPDSEMKSTDFKTLLDEVIDKGVAEDVVPEALEQFEDHNYEVITSSDFIIGYVAGYVARRVSKFTSCDNCHQSLIAKDLEDDVTRQEVYKFITLKSRGNLIYPNKKLITVIIYLEQIVLKFIRHAGLSENLLINIMQELSSGPQIPLIGCNSHKFPLSERILQFFLITRMHFICKQLNKNENSNSKTKKLRKHSKF